MNNQSSPNLSISISFTPDNKISYVLKKDGIPWDQDTATVDDYYKIITNDHDWLIFEYYESLQLIFDDDSQDDKHSIFDGEYDYYQE